MRIFGAAVVEMSNTSSEIFGPSSFQAYLEANRLPKVRTEQYLSIDFLHQLAPELREAETMVFRLGCRPGRVGTHFGLARNGGTWSNFFLDDKALLKGVKPNEFAPSVPSRRLLAFNLLPKLTETSLVNLAVASGLLQHALGLTEDHEQIIPATSQSTYSFEFLPHFGAVEPWKHVQGQVEIDAIFYGRRNNQEHLFVIEAKSGPPISTLAKHKLSYPLLALRPRIPVDIAIVPVYLKTWQEPNGRHFMVAECSPYQSQIPFISALEPVQVSHFVLNGFGI